MNILKLQKNKTMIKLNSEEIKVLIEALVFSISTDSVLEDIDEKKFINVLQKICDSEKEIINTENFQESLSVSIFNEYCDNKKIVENIINILPNIPKYKF